MSTKSKRRSYIKWTEEEVNFLKENYSNSDVKTIASVVGRTNDCVYAKASELGLKRPNVEEQRKKAARRKINLINCKAPRWTMEEIQFLKDNENKLTLQQIADQLGKSLNAVNCKRMSIKRVKSLRVTPVVDKVETENLTENHFKVWSKKDEQYLKENYGTLPVSEIARNLKRTEDAIKGRAYALGLVDEKITRAKWTKEEISFLKKSINKKTNEEMAQYLGRSVASVAAKLSELKLKKAFPLKKKKASNFFAKAFVAASVTVNVALVAYIIFTLIG